MSFDFVKQVISIGGATTEPALRFYRKGFGIGGSLSWRDIVLDGNGSLTLANAKANGLNYLKLFGGTEQDGTPTPTTPVDIVCNNGALKVRHQSGLPLGYQPYEYITASGNQWLNTGVQLASTDIVETEFKNSSRTGFGALYGVFALGNSSAFYANGTYYGYDVANGKVDTGISVDTDWHTLRQDFGNGIITIDGNNTTYTPFEFDNAKDNYLFARYYNNSYGYGFKGSCKRYKVFRNGVLICDLIPVVQLSNNAVGMYDLVNNVFRDNLGTDVFDISNPINDLELYVDGTVETVEVTGKNLFDKTQTPYDSGVYISSVTIGQTGFTTTQNANYNVYRIEVQPNTTYTFGAIKANSPYWVVADSSNKVLQTAQNSGGTEGVDITITTATSAKYLYLTVGINGTYKCDDILQLEQGLTATTYEPYFNGGSATAEMLLKVGDYKDVQNVTNGTIARNVVVKVLDGTETWSQATTSQGVYRYRFEPTDTPKLDGNRGHCISTHFFDIGSVTTQDIGGVFASTTYLYFIPNQDVDTVAKWTAFLADQYANGTPVIIVYPLAEPTTETVTPQPLTIQAGTNIVEITQGSINNLPLEVSYKGTV